MAMMPPTTQPVAKPPMMASPGQPPQAVQPPQAMPPRPQQPVPMAPRPQAPQIPAPGGMPPRPQQFHATGQQGSQPYQAQSAQAPPQGGMPPRPTGAAAQRGGGHDVDHGQQVGGGQQGPQGQPWQPGSNPFMQFMQSMFGGYQGYQGGGYPQQQFGGYGGQQFAGGSPYFNEQTGQYSGPGQGAYGGPQFQYAGNGNDWTSSNLEHGNPAAGGRGLRPYDTPQANNMQQPDGSQPGQVPNQPPPPAGGGGGSNPGGIPNQTPPPSGPGGAPQPGTGAPGSGQSFADMLYQMFQNYQGSGSAPQWNQPGNSPFNQRTQSAISDELANPSSFNLPQVQQAYKYLSGNIDDQFSQSQAKLEEDMAQRGLSDSSIRGGRLSDLNVANKSAHEQLGNQLLYQQALTGGQDRSNAIAQAMGYGNQMFGQANQGYQNQLGGFYANQGANNQNFNQQQQLLMNMLGYNQQNFNNQYQTWQGNQQNQQFYDWLKAQMAQQGSG